MRSLHELTHELNRLLERRRELERDLAAVKIDTPWQVVHVRKRELRSVVASIERLEKLLRR